MSFLIECDEIEKDGYIFLYELSKHEVCVRWNLPLLHQIPKNLIKPPGPTVRKEIEELNIPFRQGRFTLDENKIVMNNWEKLCNEYSLPDNPRAFAQWRNKSRDSKLEKVRHFVIFWLARGLSDRTPSQVYQHFIHSMGTVKKGKYTKNDITTVKKFLSDNKTHTQQELAALLGRDERSVWRCIKLNKNNNLQNKPHKITKWNLKLCDRLIRTLLSIVKKKNVSLLTTKNILKLRKHKIVWNEWVEAGNQLSLPPNHLKKHWYRKLYPQLFSPHPINLKYILVKLIKILREKKIKHWQDINWTDMESSFEYLPGLFLWRVFYGAADNYFQDKKKKFKKLIKIMHEKIIIENQPIQNKKLRRISISEKGTLCYTE